MTSPKYTFPDLLDIMARLRAPGGCPWDREQTHASLLPYLVEEAHEFIDAAEQGEPAAMREELGDVLLQVVFHAQVAREAGTFDIDGVIHDIAAKLVRRHPHVFAETAGVDTADKVTAQWDEIKKAEKNGVGGAGVDGTVSDTAPGVLDGALDGIPRSLPPLPKALKISQRAVKAGFEWPDWQGVAAKVREELEEFEAEARAGDRDAQEEELGDLLFSVVNLGRILKIDPDRALARANAKFTRRFRAMEALAATEGAPLAERSVEEMEVLWQKVKKADS